MSSSQDFSPLNLGSEESIPPLGRLPLAREDVDRGCEIRADENWLTEAWSKDSTRVLYLYGSQVPASQGHLVVCPSVGEVPENAIYLGRTQRKDDEVLDLVVVPLESNDSEPTLVSPEKFSGGSVAVGDLRWLGLRDIAAGLADAETGFFVEAVAIANWHARNKFCPRCGAPTRVIHSGWVQECTNDGSEHFPRTDPAIIVAIIDKHDRILLGNNASWGRNRFSTLAGFVEPGESLEAAVKREVFEESRVQVHSPTYMGSQPWPFPQSLMLGFTAVADAPEQAQADETEIAEVRWFSRDELRRAAERGEVLLPGSSSIARSLIESWYGGALPEPRNLEN